MQVFSTKREASPSECLLLIDQFSFELLVKTTIVNGGVQQHQISATLLFVQNVVHPSDVLVDSLLHHLITLVVAVILCSKHHLSSKSLVDVVNSLSLVASELQSLIMFVHISAHVIIV